MTDWVDDYWPRSETETSEKGRIRKKERADWDWHGSGVETGSAAY